MVAATIALNTFREAVRDRALYLILVFAFLVLASSKALGWVSVGEDLKVITDVGLAAVSFFGVMLTVFIGTGLIYKEVERRTIYHLLVRPISRASFLWGKFLGLALTSLVNWLVMSAGFLIYLHLMGGSLRAGLAMALLFIYLELALLNALTVAFAAASTPLLSAVFTVAVFILGRLAPWIGRFAQMARESELPERWREFGAGLLEALYLVFPDLSHFNLRAAAVHNLPLSPEKLFYSVLYGLAYIMLTLLAAQLFFNRRDF